MKTYWSIEVQINVFLNLALVGGKYSATRPCHFIRSKEPQFPLCRRLDGPQELFWIPKKKKSLLLLGIKFWLSICCKLLQQLSYLSICAHIYACKTPCTSQAADVSEEHILSMFRVKEQLEELLILVS
jgi:hypothetical protein